LRRGEKKKLYLLPEKRWFSSRTKKTTAGRTKVPSTTIPKRESLAGPTRVVSILTDHRARVPRLLYLGRRRKMGKEVARVSVSQGKRL